MIPRPMAKEGWRNLPTFAEVRSAAREVRRIGKINGHPLTRATVEAAWDRGNDYLQERHR